MSNFKSDTRSRGVVQFSDKPAYCGACGVYFVQILKESYDWHQVYRVVIVDRETGTNNETFSLSGLGACDYMWQYSEQELLHAPRRVDEVVQTAHDMGYSGVVVSDPCAIYPARYWNSQNCDRYPHGYAFHAKCWLLVERCLGQINQDQLEHLILAIRRYWYNNKYDLDKYLPLRNYTRPWVPCICFIYQDAAYTIWPYQTDPVDIPEVQWIIKQSTRRQVPRRSKPLQPVFPPRLPWDVYLRVLDFLDDGDAQKCGMATGLPIPGSHWSRRLNGMIYELSELPPDTTISWETAYLEMKRLSEKALGLENRQRIWKALCSIREIYRDINETRNPTSLSFYISQTYPVFRGSPVPKFAHHECTKAHPHTRFVRGDTPNSEPCVNSEPCICEMPLDKIIVID
ncbi:hypothetical protein AWENTII_007002 [Aspergillus wentii]|nr:hypothetical protein MW887_004196 [Aspergillus wentii]